VSDTLKSGVINKVRVPDRRRQAIAPGEQVRMVLPHPHAGKMGRYEGVEYLAVPNEWACKVAFADGGGCYVFHASEWEAAE